MRCLGMEAKQSQVKNVAQEERVTIAAVCIKSSFGRVGGISVTHDEV